MANPTGRPRWGLVRAAGLARAAVPRADLVWLDDLERLCRSCSPVLANVMRAESLNAVARGAVEARARQADLQWGPRDLDHDRRLRQFVTSREELVAGARLVRRIAMRGDRERFLEAGMDEYLTKPIKPDDLSAALSRILGGARVATPSSVVQTPIEPTAAASATPGIGTSSAGTAQSPPR
jgi:CheY-like chemotaxis protein